MCAIVNILYCLCILIDYLYEIVVEIKKSSYSRLKIKFYSIMNSSKAEAENIEPSAGKEMLDKYWAEIKNEIDDINIVS